jgi:hypothetical protein
VKKLGLSRSKRVTVIRRLSNRRSYLTQLDHLEEDRAWRDSIVTIFGPEFYELLMRFKGGDVRAILLAQHLVEHVKTFGGKFKSLDDPKSV